jgi:hypothetical protein
MTAHYEIRRRRMRETARGASQDKKGDSVAFTIDGRPFELEDRKQVVADLLKLAGLDPAGYNLSQVGPNNKLKPLRDEQRITIKDGDEFVAVRDEASVA